MAVTAPRRCTHGNENHVGLDHCFTQLDGEFESSCVYICRHNSFKAWLVDRNAALPQSVDFVTSLSTQTT